MHSLGTVNIHVMAALMAVHTIHCDRLTYNCSTGLQLLWCPWSCNGVTNDREGVGGSWYQSWYGHQRLRYVVSDHRSIGGAGHLIHDDHTIWITWRLPCDCNCSESCNRALHITDWSRCWCQEQIVHFTLII